MATRYAAYTAGRQHQLPASGALSGVGDESNPEQEALEAKLHAARSLQCDVVTPQLAVLLAQELLVDLEPVKPPVTTKQKPPSAAAASPRPSRRASRAQLPPRPPAVNLPSRHTLTSIATLFDIPATGQSWLALALRIRDECARRRGPAASERLLRQLHRYELHRCLHLLQLAMTIFISRHHQLAQRQKHEQAMAAAHHLTPTTPRLRRRSLLGINRDRSRSPSPSPSPSPSASPAASPRPGRRRSSLFLGAATLGQPEPNPELEEDFEADLIERLLDAATKLARTAWHACWANDEAASALLALRAGLSTQLCAPPAIAAEATAWLTSAAQALPALHARQQQRLPQHVLDEVAAADEDAAFELARLAREHQQALLTSIGHLAAQLVTMYADVLGLTPAGAQALVALHSTLAVPRVVLNEDQPPVHSLATGRDVFAVGLANGDLRLFQVAGQRCLGLHAWRAHDTTVSALALHVPPHSHRWHVFSGSRDHHVRVWDFDSERGQAQLLQTLVGHFGWIRCLAYCEGYLISGAGDETVRLWRPGNRSTTSLSTVKCHEHWVTRLVFWSPTRIVSIGADGCLALLERREAQLHLYARFELGRGRLNDADWLTSSLGHFAVVASSDGSVSAWRLEWATKSCELSSVWDHGRPNEPVPRCMAVATTSARIVSVAEDGDVLMKSIVVHEDHGLRRWTCDVTADAPLCAMLGTRILISGQRLLLY